MVSKPSFDIHESPIDVEGRHAAILHRDRRLTVSVGVYEAGFARHAFTLTVLDRAWPAKLEVERQAAPEMAAAKQVQTRLFPEPQPQTRTLYADDTVQRLGPTCTVMGLFDKWDCTMEERELASGEAVLLYTDGVTEALNGERAEFGDKRLLEAARQNCQLSLPELLVAVVDQARRFSPREQADDIMALARSCTARTVRSGPWAERLEKTNLSS